MDRQHKGKRRALTDGRFDPNPPTVHFDDALRDREPQARAPFLLGHRIVGLLKFLKQFGLIGGGNPRPGVMHGHLESAVLNRDLNGYLSIIGEFDRIADEIEQDLCQPPLVATTSRQVRGYLCNELEFFVGRQGLDRAVDRLSKR